MRKTGQTHDVIFLPFFFQVFKTVDISFFSNLFFSCLLDFHLKSIELVFFLVISWFDMWCNS
ncbi:uncharacterized protein BYT42DRAFT_579127 [Radiomyces spectabilis]|uniref:uncharacterized protein n=1 Tax=Radiomyces spectabilis TaxID=64574 RepID=UPI00221FBB55|nr:uncharacterized protein BYT42DRAFT_579127 [Radiomyces spectabilis]KAI8373080.1 hypothetical protein BYT42DRAFT_579127 [Radiomyces spectabilis]